MIGDNVRALRKELGLTQEALAAKAKVSSVAMIEAGGRKSPRQTTLRKLADALGVTVARLYEDPKRDTKKEVADSLAAFLVSPLASDAIETEIDALRRVDWRWGQPNDEAWYFLLRAIRATKK